MGEPSQPDSDTPLPEEARSAPVELEPGPDPVIEAYKRDIDRTLLRENLRRTPDERVRDLVRLQRFAEELKRAGSEASRR